MDLWLNWVSFRATFQIDLSFCMAMFGYTVSHTHKHVYARKSTQTYYICNIAHRHTNAPNLDLFEMPAIQNVCLPRWHDIWAFLSWFVAVYRLFFFFHFFEAHYIHFFSVILLICLKCSDDLFACMNYFISGWKKEIERLHWWNKCQAFYMFFLTVSQINWIIKIVEKSLIQILLGESIVPLEALKGALPCS